MIPRPPRPPRTDTLFPDTTLFRSPDTTVSDTTERQHRPQQQIVFIHVWPPQVPISFATTRARDTAQRATSALLKICQSDTILRMALSCLSESCTSEAQPCCSSMHFHAARKHEPPIVSAFGADRKAVGEGKR